MIKVVILGLPNAGKSTLFNRLIGRKVAVVHPMPGVTRDCREGIAKLGDLRFKLIDTGGWDETAVFSEEIVGRIKYGIDVADVVLFLVDYKHYNEHENTKFARWLNGYTKKPVILVANKCEESKHKYVEGYDLYSLGFAEPIYISAEHNLGMIELYSALLPSCDSDTNSDDSSDLRIKTAIVGCPNVGKSTLFNSLLGEERVITSPVMGTTRDSVDVHFRYNNRDMMIIDTAGMRKKSHITNQVEEFCVEDALKSIRRSHVVVLVIDASLGLDHQSITIAGYSLGQYKPVIIAANKWDIVHESKRKEIMSELNASNMNCDIPVVEISSLYKINCFSVLNTVIRLYDLSHRRITTAKLNKWLAKAIEHRSAPLVEGKKMKFKYVMQVDCMPPKFIFSVNMDSVDATYARYLGNSLRREFNLNHVPVLFDFRKPKNPYL